MLNELSMHFGLHFVLNACLLDRTGRPMIEFGVRNAGLSLPVLNSFLEPWLMMKENLEAKLRYSYDGGLVAMCLNDRAQDEEPTLSKVMNNAMYIVEHIHVKEGKNYFVLKDMDHGPTPGYPTDRFILVFNKSLKS